MPHRRNRKTRSLYERNQRLLLSRATTCHYCRCPISTQLPKGHPQKATADHIVPTSMGGGDELSNLIPACFYDNTRRGNLPYAEFVRIVDGELAVRVEPHSRNW